MFGWSNLMNSPIKQPEYLRVFFGNISICLAAISILAGCGETRLAIHVAKEIKDIASQSKPISEGTYKVGKPYKIKGKWYYPKADPNYDETGLASWYGPNFHGKPTANGAIFDQWAVTAAHKTLPMPTQLRVTNLENGRSLVVTVNDRGPFVDNRIIDLSRQSARLLGMERQGIAKVRVQALTATGSNQFLTPKPSQTEAQPQITASPSSTISGGELAPPDDRENDQKIIVTPSSSAISNVKIKATGLPASSTIAPEPTVTQVAVTQSPMYIQAGAFTFRDNATKLGVAISRFGTTEITPVEVNGATFYRVRLGPVNTVEEADALLLRIQQSGIENARLIIDTGN